MYLVPSFIRRNCAPFTSEAHIYVGAVLLKKNIFYCFAITRPMTALIECRRMKSGIRYIWQMGRYAKYKRVDVESILLRCWVLKSVCSCILYTQGAKVQTCCDAYTKMQFKCGMCFWDGNGSVHHAFPYKIRVYMRQEFKQHSNVLIACFFRTRF